MLRTSGFQICLSLILCASVSPWAEAQLSRRVTGTVSSSTGGPVANASVDVLGSQWSTRSRADGSFELLLPPGGWTLRAQRLGFRPVEIALVVGDSGAIPPVSFQIEPTPLALKGIVVEAPEGPPLSQSIGLQAVRRVPPLVEPDIFRAAVLIPLVSQPNDLKARIHIAGGASDETGVRLDGHPLQDPFHVLGVLGAINAAALGGATILIHHLPSAYDGHLSGILDLRSREPASEARTEATLSLIAAGGVTQQPKLWSGAELLAAGRVTYLDKFLRAAFGRSDADIPVPRFYDALLRLGLDRGPWRVEALGFRSSDGLSTLEEEDLSSPLTWGETLFGVRVLGSHHRWSARLRASLSTFGVERQRELLSQGESIDVERDHWSFSLEGSRVWERWRLSAGASVDAKRADQRWENVTGSRLISGQLPDSFAGRESHVESALFAEISGRLGSRWSASAGTRLTSVAGHYFFGPRLAVGYVPSASLRFELAANRRFQFDAQLDEPIEGSVTPPRFLLDVPRQADVYGASLDWRTPRTPIGGTGRVHLQAFAKTYRRRTLTRAAREGGQSATDIFPDLVRSEGRSVGAAIALGWTPGDSTLLQVSYTLQQTREDVVVGNVPTTYDTPHELSALASLPLGRRWTGNVVFQARSGAVSTPVKARLLVPGLEGSSAGARYVFGERNSFRAPFYTRLDVGARRVWQAWGAEWALSAQILNVTFTKNPAEYDWREFFCAAQGVCSSDAGVSRRGLPIIPSLGVEVSW
ncbi:MAG: carboxypeptidase regulatory-like domain-containing protein [Gemmatimonadaceae bacterium]